MEYIYKQLTSSDVELLKQLLQVFGEAFNEINTYQDNVPTDEYLTYLLAKQDFITVVALCNNEVVGGLTAYVLEKFEQNRREIYIYDLAVQEQHRRKGIATNVIHELKTIAKQKDAYVIYVQADHGDDAAIRLYESLGVKEDVFHFDIPIGD